MKAIVRIAGVVALLAASSSTQAHAQLSNLLGANFTLSPDGKTLSLKGDITSVTPYRLKRYLMQMTTITTLQLDSWGGEAYPSLAVALEIFEHGLNTRVPAGAGCYSGCAYAFLAGARREVAGELGVHSITAEGELFPGEEEQTFRDISQVMDLMGVAPTIVDIARSTPAAGMHVFSADELKRLGIVRQSADERPSIMLLPAARP